MKTKTFRLVTLLIIILLATPAVLMAGDKKKDKNKNEGQDYPAF